MRRDQLTIAITIFPLVHVRRRVLGKTLQYVCGGDDTCGNATMTGVQTTLQVQHTDTACGSTQESTRRMGDGQLLNGEVHSTNRSQTPTSRVVDLDEDPPDSPGGAEVKSRRVQGRTITECSCKTAGEWQNLAQENRTNEDLPKMKECTCGDAISCENFLPISDLRQHLRRSLSKTRRRGVKMESVVSDEDDVFHNSDDLNRLEKDGDDDDDDGDVRQCKTFMEDLVDRIFNKSASICQADNAKFGEYCQFAIGRLWFARLVNSQRVHSKKVSEQTFYRLVQFLAVCLFECYEADDFTPVKTLMNMCFTFYHEHEGYPRCENTTKKSFLYSHLTEQPIWKSSRFWSATFFDAVHHERKQRSPENQGTWRCQSTEEREDTETLNENITFGQLATFLHNMMELELPQEMCEEFFHKMATIGNLSQDQTDLLERNIEQHFQSDCHDNNSGIKQRQQQQPKRHKKLNFMKRKVSREALM